MDSFILHTLKTMSEHHVEDTVWKSQQELTKVKSWKLFDSCGVHYVTMKNILYYLLVEKMYPLTNHTLHQMFSNVKLQVNEECEMAYELLRLVKKQLKEGYKVSAKKDNVEVAQESSSKRAGDELEQEIAKKQRIKDENEYVELKRCLQLSLDNRDDVTIDATPLSSKSPTIVDYKIEKEGRKSFLQIIKADGNS
uniref:Uncharacterized protein n=1 Tax=Tanacetum cinerariifolium TaxID=118510 RepID=A0A6L2KT71_TANCI|nr:hypothetical protein [Tanacetum cinerariifolium]